MRIKTKEDRRDRIKLRLRKRIAGTTDRPRLSVFRSVTHIYVQVIEPSLKAALGDGARGGNSKGAEAVGKAIAERLKAKGITRVVFDRNGFLYHGRIKAVADAARSAGLEF
jgi:large subunit ribosomal protein L18